MLAKVMSCPIVGLEAQQVEVEVDITSGQPLFNVVGLPDAAVRESPPEQSFAMIVTHTELELHTAQLTAERGWLPTKRVIGVVKVVTAAGEDTLSEDDKKLYAEYRRILKLFNEALVDARMERYFGGLYED